jgi:hypothetical protein
MKAYVEKQIFSQEYFSFLKNYFINHSFLSDAKHDFYGSKRIDSFDDKILKDALNMLTEKAKKMFNSDTLIPTYAVFSEYSGKQAMLNSHKDVGPCTYTIDMALYYNEPWPLIVEGEYYTFLENEAVVFYANDQLHWKPAFPSPETNKVAIILFHFAEPTNQWWSINEKLRSVMRKKFKATS